MQAYVRTATGQLFAECLGNDTRPWLLLSNSLGADQSMWEPQLAAFSAAYGVIRYDARGHGASSVPDHAYSIDDLADDALAVADFFGVGRFSFLGLSLGGMTGLGVALRAPGRIERLVCANARADAPADFAEAWRGRAEIARAEGLTSLADPTLARWFSGTARGEGPIALQQARRMFLRTPPEGYAKAAEALASLDYLPRLPAVASPTLYVAGELDAGIPSTVVKAMADVTPAARFAVVPDGGHLSNLDNPAGFLAAVSAFLALHP